MIQIYNTLTKEKEAFKPQCSNIFIKSCNKFSCYFLNRQPRFLTSFDDLIINIGIGKTIDIHAGGQDLEFPHHENEIAQSEAKNGQKFANYWMHNGFVTIGQDDEKMSKSLGNFVTVHELVKKLDPQIGHVHWPLVLRHRSIDPKVFRSL